MSAYVVQKETIDRVLSACFQNDPYVRDAFNLRGAPDDYLNLVGQDLWKMNAAAVGCRYNEKPESLPAYRFTFRIQHKVQYLKSCQCLHYQCSEGEMIEKLPLYKMLSLLIRDLQSSIIAGLTEYNEAQWA